MSKYKIIKKNGKQYIVDENGNKVSKNWKEVWANGLVNGESDYYKAQRDDEKEAIFHKDNPDKPISKWWRWIVITDGLVKGESDYYKAHTDGGVGSIFHKDYKDIPLIDWKSYVDLYTFIEKHKDIPISKVISNRIKMYMKKLC